MTTYYNEYDPYAAQWLRNLMANSLIPSGVVDSRNVFEVNKFDVSRFSQCHFFAGIGGWARALDLAEWPRNRPVWTCSLPCQPFSQAGKKLAEKDKRHLWPTMLALISSNKPTTILGEQVSSSLALSWLDTVFSDLERENYTCRAIDTGAACVGAPHIRQRLYWMAHSTSIRRESVCTLPTSHGTGDEGQNNAGEKGRTPLQPERESSPVQIQKRTNGFWERANWTPCHDGLNRPFEPGTYPLVDGIPPRMGRLRAYGNAIVPPLAAEIIKTWMLDLESGTNEAMKR